MAQNKKAGGKISPGVSVIIPAYNEESVIDMTMESVLGALKKSCIENYEILVFDDNSTDRTGEMIDVWAAKNKRIKAIHNKPNRGFGGNYTEGVRLATKEYAILVPGDNEINGDSIAEVLRLAGSADMIATYTANMEVRPVSRRIISKLYTLIVNTMFGLDARYYNGISLIRKADLDLIGVDATDFAYMTKTLVRLIKLGRTYNEVGITLQPRGHGSSSAFKPKNVIGVFRTIGLLFLEVQILDRGKYRR